jgi:UDP-N-acetylmuramoyl-L-alanyl-D-glutamate--2,6-diaminopimelate ligase
MMASAHHTPATDTTTLGDLLAGWVSELDDATARRVISDLSLHSAMIASGSVFVAVAGQRGHGLDHAEHALARGADIILHNGDGDGDSDSERIKSLAQRATLIEVPHLRERLPQLAARLWPGLDQLDVLAVTGTNGKTSLAWLLAQALDGGMIGTLGVGRPGEQQRSSHTTPDVLSVYRHLAALHRQGISPVVLEASSHALHQDRLAGLRWSSAMFTNLGHDHLDYHGSRDQYAAAKQRLFMDFSSQRQLINGDDPFGQALIRSLQDQGQAPLSYGFSDDADGQVTVIASTPTGLELALRLGSLRMTVSSRLIGEANAYNLLVVALELFQRGLTEEEIRDRLERLRPVPGRMHALIDTPCANQTGPAQVIIDYAHDADALHSALVACRALTRGQLWCVFGCGGDRDRSKRPRMGRVAESLADQVILTDDNPRHEDGLVIIRDIQSGMHHPERARVERDRAQAIATALQAAGSEDVVLVAGKGHECEQIVGDQHLPFSDQHQVTDWLEARS